MSETFDYRAVGGVMVTRGPGGVAWDFGWQRDDGESARIADLQPFITAAATPAAHAGDLPKQVYLWDAYRKLYGSLPPAKNQGQVGSCVSFGTNTAVRRTMAVEIALKGEAEEWTDIVEEVTYGGSRVEVGGGRINGDGSVGAWAAEFVKGWGVIARGKHGSYDLSTYSESTCRSFGGRGVPDDLEPAVKLHPVRGVTKVTAWADAKAMLASGYGIAICSDQGFSMRRDARGVAAPSGSWAHCMCLDGYVESDSGEFGHITNSWGDSAHSGPVGWGDPGADGFWAESRVVARMLSQGDSWAFSDLAGFPARRIDWRKVL